MTNRPVRVWRYAIPISIALTAGAAGCGGGLPAAKPDAVHVALAPDVVSSQEGSLRVRATVVDASTPLKGWSVRILLDYTDRNGTRRTIAGPTAETDRTGALEHVFEGLLWEGAGLVTAEVLDEEGQPYLGRDDSPVEGAATFSVLDKTPPVVTIIPPADNKVGPGLPVDIEVQAQDEIGISQVFFQAAGEVTVSESSLVASGSTNGAVTFDFDVPGGAIPGPTITLYAMAADMSGNLSASAPITLTVDPSIAIAVPNGFSGTLLTEGAGGFLNDPTALAVSPKDGMIYIADNSGGAPCNGGCVRRVNPNDGTVAMAAVYVGTSRIEGIAFDATGDNLYLTDRPEQIVRLTYDAGAAAYQNPTACNMIGNLPGPYHLLFDAALGLMVADQSDQVLKQQPACDNMAAPADFTAAVFDTPWGIARKPAAELLVSDDGLDRIWSVTAAGATGVWETFGLDQPRGIDWLAGGQSTYADSLLVANFGNQRVVSTRGGFTTRTVATLRNDPIDVSLANGTLYVLTRPSAGNPGRIFRVSGF